MTTNPISRWLHDKSPVKRSTLAIWAATTGVDPEWLETGTAGLDPVWLGRLRVVS